MGSLIQVSESNAIVFISSTPFFGQLTTIRDISGKRSSSNTIVVSTVGITFGDGTIRKVIDTPYATITLDSAAKVVHQFPFTYNVSRDAEGLTTQNFLQVDGVTSVYDSLFSYTSISSFGPMDAHSITVGNLSNPSITRPLLVSTVEGLGQTYVSSILLPIDTYPSSGYVIRSNVVSTVVGLGLSYISLPSLQSTTDGLGSFNYVSTASLTSTVQSLSTSYIMMSNLTSTVVGLGTFGYVSSADFASTATSFRGGFIRDPSYQSTIAGLATSSYVCTSQLGSTLNGLGTAGYISTDSLVSTTVGLINSPFTGTTSLYVSTTEGLGQSYISTAALTSSVVGVLAFTESNLRSTIDGLGRSGYVSTSQLTSTVGGLGQLYISSSVLVSTVGGLFNSNYTLSFTSTVGGLGTTGYLSTLQPFTSSVIGYQAVQMMSTVARAGTPYLSTTGLFSTVERLSNIYITVPMLISSVGGGTTFNTSNLVSTVCGLGSLPDPYISSTQLFSTVSNVSVTNAVLFSETLKNLGSSYFSTLSLFSTVQGLSNLYATPSNLISSVAGIGAFNTASLVSTVCGLGSLADPYISTPQLVSTVSNVTSIHEALFTETIKNLGSSYFSTLSLFSTVQGLSNLYATPSNLISSVAGIGAFNTASLVSTVCGLGSLSDPYISTPQLMSTVSNVTSIHATLFTETIKNLGSSYFSTLSLFSTVQGLSNLYATPSHLISSVAGIGAFNTASLVSTVCGMASSSYVSSTQLFSTVSNVVSINDALFSKTIDSLGSSPYFYLSTASIVSTVQELSNIYIVKSNLISTVAQISAFNTCNLISTLNGMGNSSYISTPQLTSTVVNLFNIDSILYNQVIPSLASDPYNYISTASLTSTVRGLPYVTGPQLVSVVAADTTLFTANLLSTVRGLRFIGQPPDLGGPLVIGSDNSLFFASEFLSSIVGVLQIDSALFSNALVTIGNTYVANEALFSTVIGLNAFSLLSVNNQLPQVASTIVGLQASNASLIPPYITSLLNGLVLDSQSIASVSNVNVVNTGFHTNLVANLASPPYSYISIPSLVSTVQGLSNIYVLSSGLLSTTSNLTLYNTSTMVSTVAGLGSYVYVSSTQLFSTVSNLTGLNLGLTTAMINSLGSLSYISVASLVSTVEGLGNIYISSPSLLFSVSNFIVSQKYSDAQLTSSIANLGTKSYYSTGSLASTVDGLGSASYISLSQLVSTVNGASNLYVTIAGIPGTTSNILSNLIVSKLPSTVAGLGSLGYVSSQGSADNPGIVAQQRQTLIAATTLVQNSLGGQPSATSCNLIIPRQSSPSLYIYQSNVILPSSNVFVVGDGIRSGDIYCTSIFQANIFWASNYYADGTQLTSSSDRRLKYDIVPLSNALNSLQQIQGISYTRIDTPDKPCIGFIAQDIEKIYPELIFKYTPMKSVKYDSIGVILLEAIKELNCECDDMLRSLLLSSAHRGGS